VIILFVYLEYRNEKKYQEERRQKRPSVKKEEKKPLRKPTKVPSAKELEAKKEQEKKLEEKKLEEKRLEEKRLEEKRLEEKRLEEKKLEEKKQELKSTTVSLADYPKFDHSRLMEMGLSEEEAKEFVAELIPQIGAQIPLIKEAIAISDFHDLEQLTHSIKGSSSTVGTGGISDLLDDFNTYLKTGKEPTIIEAYFEHLKHYYEELKRQYS
jgi:HPt (histidine-containing phosphotransfer) domain-containing protein